MDTRDDEELRPAGRSAPQVSRTHHEKAYMSELGLRLRRLREGRDLTQQAVAKAAGIATDMVSRLENGHYASPGLRTLFRIAEGMGLTISTLLPDVPSSDHSGPEAVYRARLNTLLHQLEIDDLELVVAITGAIVERRQH